MKTFKGELFLGIAIVIAGLALLTNNLGLTEWDVWKFVTLLWPLILLYWGIGYLINHQSKGEVFSGVLIVFLGLAFLGNNFGLIEFSFQMIWRIALPVLLILFGINLIRAKTGHNDKHFRAVLGGLEKKGNWEVESGTYTVFMGGIDLDLRDAQIPLGETVLHINVMMGGVDIIVPKDLNVICEGSVYLGGMEMLDRSTGGIVGATTATQTGSDDPARTLYIKFTGLMGGIEVKAK